jgi:streptogrisin C
VRRISWLKFGAVAVVMQVAAVDAQTIAPVRPAAPTLQPTADAFAQDAVAVADRLDVSADEAARRLRLQAASVAAAQTFADRYAGRLAGVAIEHRPAFRIVLLLTGDAPVPDTVVNVDGTPVLLVFRVGARATHTDLVQAITAYQAAIRASLIAPPGLGVDQRTGELVAIVSARDVVREGHDPLRDRLAALTHVPIRLRVVDQPALDLAGPGSGIEGGGRMVGSVPGDTRRYLCTAGFAVTDGVRTAMTTAAHCPDTLNMRDREGREQTLGFVGQWGWGHQDVQINASADPLGPSFFADTGKTISRPVTGAAPRAGMRAGDVVCHRGESTGYSCAQVELTDFAPAGDLCGGACLPTWTTVSGPGCKAGDSGSPVFLGTTAYGILKGGSYRFNGSCAFYFYMSTDFLPAGWRLLTIDPAAPAVIVPPPSVLEAAPVP